MNHEHALQITIADLVQTGRGILAADESTPTIAKRFQAIGVESTEENRRTYRSLLLTTPGLGEFISGVILFEETLAQQSDAATLLPAAAWAQKIVPGIKVDKGKIPLALHPGDEVTEGLDDLAKRLASYHEQGARFAKWREVYTIGEYLPSANGIEANAEMLARYAAVCQNDGFVPIVEPEVLLDGKHTIERCEEVTEETLRITFSALMEQRVHLEGMILKPSMVVSGKDNARQAGVDEVAERTIRCLKRTVPGAVPGIAFLSGGQSAVSATEHLNKMNQIGPQPWQVSFSFARALQDPALKAWKGEPGNVAAAQKVFYHRAKMNSAARSGSYTQAMEAAAA